MVMQSTTLQRPCFAGEGLHPCWLCCIILRLLPL